MNSVGRAGFILDNLVAAKKAKPMLIVMPAGHTRRGAAAGGAIGRTATDEFVKDFTADVMPYVEKNYRVQTDRSNTAIAGLSMGGNDALQVGIPHLNRFGYIGVYTRACSARSQGSAEAAAARRRPHRRVRQRPQQHPPRPRPRRPPPRRLRLRRRRPQTGKNSTPPPSPTQISRRDSRCSGSPPARTIFC